MTLKNTMGLVLYECPVCGIINKKRKGMAHHLRRHHPGVKMSDCKRISAKNHEYLETKAEDSA